VGNNLITVGCDETAEYGHPKMKRQALEPEVGTFPARIALLGGPGLHGPVARVPQRCGSGFSLKLLAEEHNATNARMTFNVGIPDPETVASNRSGVRRSAGDDD